MKRCLSQCGRARTNKSVSNSRLAMSAVGEDHWRRAVHKLLDARDDRVLFLVPCLTYSQYHLRTICLKLANDYLKVEHAGVRRIMILDRTRTTVQYMKDNWIFPESARISRRTYAVSLNGSNGVTRTIAHVQPMDYCRPPDADLYIFRMTRGDQQDITYLAQLLPAVRSVGARRAIVLVNTNGFCRWRVHFDEISMSLMRQYARRETLLACLARRAVPVELRRLIGCLVPVVDLADIKAVTRPWD